MFVGPDECGLYRRADRLHVTCCVRARHRTRGAIVPEGNVDFNYSARLRRLFDAVKSFRERTEENNKKKKGEEEGRKKLIRTYNTGIIIINPITLAGTKNCTVGKRRKEGNEIKKKANMHRDSTHYLRK